LILINNIKTELKLHDNKIKIKIMIKQEKINKNTEKIYQEKK